MQQHVGLAVPIDSPFSITVNAARTRGGDRSRKPTFAGLYRILDLEFGQFTLTERSEPGLSVFDERVEVLTVAGTGASFEIGNCLAVCS